MEKFLSLKERKKMLKSMMDLPINTIIKLMENLNPIERELTTYLVEDNILKYKLLYASLTIKLKELAELIPLSSSFDYSIQENKELETVSKDKITSIDQAYLKMYIKNRIK